jgi:foldase protein PrsA
MLLITRSTPTYTKQPSLVVLAAALCAMLVGCGGATPTTRQAGSDTPSASSGSSTATPASTKQADIPLDATVATVAGKAITWGVLRHQMAIGIPKREVPAPPYFNACVARLRAAGSRSSSGEPSDAMLREQCRRRYQSLLGPALSVLIHSQWLFGEAKKIGYRVDRAAVQHELRENTRGALSAIAAQGETISDIGQNLVLQQISEHLYESVKRKTPRVDHALLARYYAANRKRFAAPEARDLHILRTISAAAAEKARSEIKAGRSFSSLVKQSALPQPVTTKDGLLLGLTPHFFSEKVLNDAIFRARVHELTGPVRISLGFYVFEVLRIHAPHQRTLAEVQPELKRQLPERLHRQVLAEATSRFKRKWKARTDCRPGYVVRGCRQFESNASTRPEGDQYAF